MLTVNNKLRPKRKPEGRCVSCETAIVTKRKYCDDCSPYQSCKDATIGEYRNRLSVKGKHPSWLHSHVRNFAKSWNKELLNSPCANCNYDLHVELCHIKPLSSFRDDALLSVVNSPNNIVVLCRNCHWEFDHGQLSLKDIQD